MNENIKIYQTSDYDWVASPLNLEDTVEWYRKEFGQDTIESIDEVEECKANSIEFWDEVDINTPLTEYIPGEKSRVGAVRLLHGTKWRLTNAKIYVERMTREITEPFIIASTEY
jgi:hypothetical protein